MSWLYDPNDLISDVVQKPDVEIMNVEDRGEYFNPPEGTIGIVVHTSTFPAAVACWYGPTHDVEWNVYGDQAPGTQQMYFLAGTKTVFVGTF